MSVIFTVFVRFRCFLIDFASFFAVFSQKQGVFIKNITKAGLDLSRVTVTKGWFKDTLIPETANKIKLRQVACAYVDCDIYESAVDVLEFLRPFLQSGSILIFDIRFIHTSNLFTFLLYIPLTFIFNHYLRGISEQS